MANPIRSPAKVMSAPIDRLSIMLLQPALFDAARDRAAEASQVAQPNARSRGAIFTKPSVVEFMLDLVGYTVDKDLWTASLLEPACGSGQFLFAAVRRLLSAWRRSGVADAALDPAIFAVELDGPTFRATRAGLVALLLAEGLPAGSAERLADSWLVCGDYLVTPIDNQFDFVVGNPPYIRQELLPPKRLAEYRGLYPTMVGRADIYVAFFEKSLGLLKPGAVSCLICSDAWTRNDYGRELRRLVTGQHALRIYVDMYGLDAFESDVGAYTSITVIERGAAGLVRTAAPTSTDAAELKQLGESLRDDAASVQLVPAPTRGDGPWLLRGNRTQDVVRELEARLPALEQAGCRVGIGVATGADSIFVGAYDELPVEASRKLPLAVNKDICQGRIEWHGLGVINPWADGGGLVSLSEFPQLAAYLEPHRDRLSRRHTAKDDPAARWYKTIDRITPNLTGQPKLLVPDIRGDGDAIAFEEGKLYPHHNLYYITSQTWDLQALQALLRSGLARLFVDAYAVKIGGGYLRFQAQYLRRIRVPAWASIDVEVQAQLQQAGVDGVKVAPAVIEQVCGLRTGSLGFMREWR